MNFNELDKLVKQHEGDIYLMTKTIETMSENINDLLAKYEMLLNRIKCAECQIRQKQETDPSTDLMV